MTDLTQLVIRYQDTGYGYEEIVRKTSVMIYRYPGTIPSLTDDDRGDFLLYFTPRLKQIVSRYQPERAEFEPYLRMCMKYRIMSYLISRHRTTRYDPADTHIGSWELRETPDASELHSVTIDTSVIGSLLEPPVQRVLRRLSRTSVLCFCLKAICDADERTIIRIAELCSSDATWLMHCKYVLLETLGPRRRRQALIGARIGRLYTRIYNLEKRLYGESDPVTRRSLDQKLANSRRLYQQNCRRLRRLSLRPTNSNIAALLHVAKGTVDNAVFTVRNALEKAISEGR
ncbi:MAG: hypothetical protein EA383_12325 [Spirochaetaceae bacterium]|nr:MAG: hypothetical protein EA383_12325 [Spirochaetaceae bacterium]